MENYRIKTRAEFERDYGVHWRHVVSGLWVDDMDYLLGQPLSSIVVQGSIEECLQGKGRLNVDKRGGIAVAWILSKDMITSDPPPAVPYKKAPDTVSKADRLCSLVDEVKVL